MMASLDDSYFREENEFELYWGIEEPYWRKPKRNVWHCDSKIILLLFKLLNQSPVLLGDLQSYAATSLSAVWYAVLVILPGLCSIVAWLAYALSIGDLHSFTEATGNGNIPRWLMSVAIIFISTFNTGAAISGPALYLALVSIIVGHSTSVVRDSYVLIQANTTIIAALVSTATRPHLELNTLIYGGLGGITGILIGLTSLRNTPQDAYTKMYLTCIWLGFAISTVLSNFQHNGRVFHTLERTNAKAGMVVPWDWRALFLLCAGFIGGALSAVSGPGVELCLYAVSVHFFQISERLIVPTVGAVMAVVCMVGALYQQYGNGGIEAEAAQLWFVSIPVVAVCATVGAVVGARMHRLVIVTFNSMIPAGWMVVVMCVVRPWTTAHTATPADLSVKSAALFFTALVLFVALWMGGLHFTGLTGTSGLYDESLEGDGHLVIKKGKRKVPAVPRTVGLEDCDSKDDDLEDFELPGSLYPPKEQLTPSEKEHEMVVLRLPCMGNSYEEDGRVGGADSSASSVEQV